MKTIAIINGNIITPIRIIKNGCIFIGKGKIQGVYDGTPKSLPEGCRVINADGKNVSPGFIDIHVHGGNGGDVMDATFEALRDMTRVHLEHGTTSLYPTTEASGWEDLYLALDNLKKIKGRIMAPNIMGVHLEGPYFSQAQAGAQDTENMYEPDPDVYIRLLEEYPEIKRISMAPEIKGCSELSRYLKKKGIVSAIAHTDASYSDIVKAIEDGFTVGTHIYSGMSTVHRKNAWRIAGAVEACLLHDELFVEVIADGCHLPPSLLKLIYKCKGSDKIALITDGIRGVGLDDGEYILTGDRKLIVEDGVAKLPDRSAFAGSTATFDRLIKTMVNMADVPLIEAVKMGTMTPARIMKIDTKKGIIAKGMDADIIIFDKDINVSTVIVNGVIQ